MIFQTTFDIKAQYKLLAQVCGINLAGPVRDPKVAAWLVDPGAAEANLHRLVHTYLQAETHLLEGINLTIFSRRVAQRYAFANKAAHLRIFGM